MQSKNRFAQKYITLETNSEQQALSTGFKFPTSKEALKVSSQWRKSEFRVFSIVRLRMFEYMLQSDVSSWGFPSTL